MIYAFNKMIWSVDWGEALPGLESVSQDLGLCSQGLGMVWVCFPRIHILNFMNSCAYMLKNILYLIIHMRHRATNYSTIQILLRAETGNYRRGAKRGRSYTKKTYSLKKFWYQINRYLIIFFLFFYETILDMSGSI